MAKRSGIPWLLLLVGCSGGGHPPPATTPDAGMTADGGGTASGPSFEVEVIDGVGANHARVGDNATLALDKDGNPTVAYGAVPAGSTTYEIRYAVRGSDGTWTPEKVVAPGVHVPGATGQIVGLGLAHVDGVPNVVYLGGGTDNNPLTPFPTDLMVSQKPGSMWMERTLVKLSNEATCTCPGTQDYCNFGNVVGSHASIRARPGGGGYAIVYRDTHNGFARDDLDKADVEVLTQGGSPGHVCADAVRGGGAFAEVAYTQDKKVVIAYNLERQAGPTPITGVWAAAWDGAAWQRKQVWPNTALSKLALGTAPDGTLYLAIADSGDVDLVVATSTSAGRSWHATAVDSAGKTGLAPSITFDGTGRPVVAYAYCGAESDSGCPGTPSGKARIRIARLEDGAWKTYQVDDGQGFGKVGLFTSIVTTSDGKLGIAFVDDMNGALLYAREM